MHVMKVTFAKVNPFMVSQGQLLIVDFVPFVMWFRLSWLVFHDLFYRTSWDDADELLYRKCQDYVYIKMKYYVENKAQLDTWK